LEVATALNIHCHHILQIGVRGMKTVVFFVGLFVASTDCFAQGTFEFRANLIRTPNSPPETAWCETASHFSLNGNILAGMATFSTDLFATDAVVRSRDGVIVSSGQISPNPTFPGGDGNPFVVVDAIWSAAPLDEQRINELMRGELTVSILARAQAGGFIEGPLLMVPEPGTAALTALGLLYLTCRFRQPCHSAK
jgi:hypothetical protein